MNHFEIISRLNTLGIKHRDHPNSKGWLDVICPMHNDHGYGNAGINIYTGVISCYRCGNKIHIDKLYKDRFNQEPNTKIEYTSPPEEKKESKVNRYITGTNYNFTHTILKPEKFQYTSTRGFTKEFINYFNLCHVLSGIYMDYMCLPIKDAKKNLLGIEFRKLCEYETLKSYFNRDLSLSQLKKYFKKYVKDNNIYLDENYCVHKNNEIINDDNLKYLLQKKVLYPSGFNINKSIFQIDNLNYDETLWFTEGIGSMPKLWKYISKNCSCSFGSNVSCDQIEYLQKFTQINLIVDQDSAGFKMVSFLHKQLKNLMIIDIPYEDTDNEYIEVIKNCKLKSSKEYISENIFKYY